MRNYFIKKLIKEAKKNKKIVLVVGDLGFNVVEDFKKLFPKRFYNAGVAEQNMIGIASGLALEGYHVFVYSIANFPTFRCAEQIRNDIDYHKLSVTIVSVGSGLGYGNLGYTHHGLQDYSLIRSFPNMLIASPADNQELDGCMNYIFKNPKPSYLRLEKSLDHNLSSRSFKIFPGKWIHYKKNKSQKIIISTGGLSRHFYEVIKKYPDFNHCTIPMWGMSVKQSQFSKLIKFKKIISLESHFQDGGFGSWLLESMSLKENRKNIKFLTKFISKNVIGKVGSEDYLSKKFGFK